MNGMIIGIILLYGGLAYLALFQPKIWFERFIQRPNRSVGLRVTIENEKKFRQFRVVFGSVFLVAAGFLIWVFPHVK